MKKLSLFMFILVGMASWMGCTTSRQVGGIPDVQSNPAPGDRNTRTAVNTGTAGASNHTQSEPQILNIYSKFLNLDSSSIRVYYFIDVFVGPNRMPIDDFQKTFILNYVIYSDYGTRDRLGYGNVPLAEANVFQAGQRIGIWVDVKKPAGKENGVLLTEITQPGTLRKMLNDLQVRFNSEQRTSDQYGVFVNDNPIPHDHHFVKQNDTFTVKKLTGNQAELTVDFYRHVFNPAVSPMNTKANVISEQLTADRTFTVQAGQELRMEEEGLYYFRSDTLKKEGIGILVTDNRYPKLTRPEKLVEPLRYMSTNQEISTIETADNFKKSLDRYWLNLTGGNIELAKNSIRNYYSRVEEANQLFTSYKEGWKTDKGMLFIILGPPDRVQKSRDKEVWVYDRRANATNVNFTFNRKTNQFVDDHYELVRYVEYQPIWYPSVEAWRNGSIR
jgi:GWxTD domain-containing protein